jgi:Rieske Fe-S protein
MGAASGLAGACGADAAVGPAAFGDAPAGNVADIPVGTLRRVGTLPVFIARDAGGLYALTSTCTHAGCDVESEGTGNGAILSCPCHGSLFDRNGGVTRGPAPTALVHFAVEVDAAGNVTIHGGTQVGAGTRVAVV